MRTLTLLIAASLTSAAQAQDLGGSLNVEMGSIANHDPSYNLFSNGDGMRSMGLRGGVRLGEHLTVLGGWHRARRGAVVYVGNNDTGSEDGASFNAALFADELSLGAQAGLPVGDFIYPYVGVDAMLFRGVMKFDEDLSTRNNAGQVVAAGAAPGILPVGGIEFRSPTGVDDVEVGFYFELGYSAFANANFGDLGQMKPGGLSARGGLGVRF